MFQGDLRPDFVPTVGKWLMVSYYRRKSEILARATMVKILYVYLREMIDGKLPLQRKCDPCLVAVESPSELV